MNLVVDTGTIRTCERFYGMWTMPVPALLVIGLIDRHVEAIHPRLRGIHWQQGDGKDVPSLPVLRATYRNVTTKSWEARHLKVYLAKRDAISL